MTLHTLVTESRSGAQPERLVGTLRGRRTPSRGLIGLSVPHTLDDFGKGVQEAVQSNRAVLMLRSQPAQPTHPFSIEHHRRVKWRADEPASERARALHEEGCAGCAGCAASPASAHRQDGASASSGDGLISPFAEFTLEYVGSLATALRLDRPLAARVDRVAEALRSRAAGVPVARSAALRLLVERGLAVVEHELGLADLPPVGSSIGGARHG